MPKLVNLDRVAHLKFRVQEERAFSVCRNLTMCPVILDEIPRLVVEYPIVFVKNGEAGKYISVALFGADPEVNLYWREDRWNSYSVPINIGRQPFFVATTDNTIGAAGPAGLITCIDVENPAVQTEVGEALFDESGKETPYLRHKLALLAELVDGEQRSEQFVEKADSLGLIRPIQLELRAPGAEPRKISGLHSIDEPKLRALDGATLAELNSSGQLHAMHAMLSSLGQLQILARRSGRLKT